MNVATLAFECEREVALGELGTANRSRLAELAGDWLEFEPRSGRVVVRHVQPGGAPALSAVPAELMAMLDALEPGELADPVDSLEGELVVGSFSPHALEREFRLRLARGEARAEPPSLWREG